MATAIKPATTGISELRHINLCWRENPSAQRLLDIVSAILAEEYCRTARENPDIFITKDKP